MNPRITEIHRRVELLLRCKAKHIQSHTETVEFAGEKVSRSVEAFSLEGRVDDARRAYAWEKLGDGTRQNPEYTIVVKAPGINSAQDALKAAAVAILKSL